MGTRALISINGKPFIAIHWDGYMEGLGKDLLNGDKSIESIIEIAKSHTIDCADKSILEKINNERIKKISEKHNLSLDEVEKGIRRGNVICCDDYEICDIEYYGDWAEYEYNIRDNEIYVRKLIGSYPDSIEGAMDFMLLTDELISEPDILFDNEKYEEYRKMQLDKVDKRIEEMKKDKETMKSVNI